MCIRDSQKGCDLIINIIDRLLQKDIQFVILGTGDYLYEMCIRDSIKLRMPYTFSPAVRLRMIRSVVKRETAPVSYTHLIKKHKLMIKLDIDY